MQIIYQNISEAILASFYLGEVIKLPHPCIATCQPLHIMRKDLEHLQFCSKGVNRNAAGSLSGRVRKSLGSLGQMSF